MKTLAGFHAIVGRLRQKADTVKEIYIDATRNDGRARDLKAMAERYGVRVITVDMKRLDGMAGGVRHQGVVAQAEELDMPKFIEDVLEAIEEPPLLLILDGVQDPHNLGACLRVADGAGAHAVIAPKDRSRGSHQRGRQGRLGRRGIGAVHRGDQPCTHDAGPEGPRHLADRHRR